MITHDHVMKIPTVVYAGARCGSPEIPSPGQAGWANAKLQYQVWESLVLGVELRATRFATHEQFDALQHVQVMNWL